MGDYDTVLMNWILKTLENLCNISDQQHIETKRHLHDLILELCRHVIGQIPVILMDILPSSCKRWWLDKF